jgi:protein subunit release factor A
MSHDPDPDASGESLEIPADDDALLAQCRVETFRAGGPGGQHQNVTESGVRLVHMPTGVRVTAREERSQHRNRTIALDRLRGRLEEMRRPSRPRKPTAVPRKEKARRLEEKRRRGTTKRLRKPPEVDD